MNTEGHTMDTHSGHTHSAKRARCMQSKESQTASTHEPNQHKNSASTHELSPHMKYTERNLHSHKNYLELVSVSSKLGRKKKEKEFGKKREHEKKTKE
jgi:hypothetical protein